MTDLSPHPRRSLPRTCSLAFALAGAFGALAAGSARAQAQAQAQTQTQARTAASPGSRAPNMADYIVAVVNQELVTNAELESRLARIRDDAGRANTRLPPSEELRKQVLQALIDERVQVTNAREVSPKIDEAELDRAVGNVAVQNQLTVAQLRERLKQQGLPYATFRANVKDQMMVERVREREVNQRIAIGDAEVDAYLDQRRAAAGRSPQIDIAQVLVTVPDGATPAQLEQRRARAEAALRRIEGGEPFEAVAREISEDGNRAQGGVIGMRPADRLPDVFVEAVRTLAPGQVSPTLLRTGAGFHVLKLLDRQAASAFVVSQTHARHILLRVSPQLSAEAATARLVEFRRQIQSGTRSFEQLARANSEDASASIGGDLGWSAPGTFVPEFEETMDNLPINGISNPLVSRFGVHLIQVLERRDVELDLKQQREQARNVLREQRFETAYLDWVRDLRGRAYVEMRDAPS